MVIEVQNCSDCPFHYDVFNDYSTGKDTTDFCALAGHLCCGEAIIGWRDGWQEEPKLPPKWCPLDIVTVKRTTDENTKPTL